MQIATMVQSNVVHILNFRQSSTDENLIENRL